MNSELNTQFTFFELLRRGDNRQFVVPELQRDYVWEKKKLAAGGRPAAGKLPGLPGARRDAGGHGGADGH